MARRHDRRRREDRRVRAAAEQATRDARRSSAPFLVHGWQTGVIRFGRHEDAVLRLRWSGVKLPFDPDAVNPIEGLKELTILALDGDHQDRN